MSESKLLEQITADWLAQHRNGHSDDEAEQAALRKRVMATVGTIRSDSTRSQRTGELVSEIISKKHRKESDALKRRSAAGLIDAGAILAILETGDEWHSACLEALLSVRMPLLTTGAVPRLAPSKP